MQSKEEEEKEEGGLRAWIIFIQSMDWGSNTLQTNK